MRYFSAALLLLILTPYGRNADGNAQYEEALRAYEAVLLRRPNRLNSLVGAGRAAELAGKESAAATHYQRAVSLVTDAEGETARLQSAQAFLAANLKP